MKLKNQNPNFNPLNRVAAFTLVELLLVVVILGVLADIVLP